MSETFWWVIVLWGFGLISAWFGFVGYLRLRALQMKETLIEKKMILGTGATLGEEVVDDTTDAKEFRNEQIAHLRGRAEKRRQ